MPDPTNCKRTHQHPLSRIHAQSRQRCQQLKMSWVQKFFSSAHFVTATRELRDFTASRVIVKLGKCHELISAWDLMILRTPFTNLHIWFSEWTWALHAAMFCHALVCNTRTAVTRGSITYFLITIENLMSHAAAIRTCTQFGTLICTALHGAAQSLNAQMSFAAGS